MTSEILTLLSWTEDGLESFVGDIWVSLKRQKIADELTLYDDTQLPIPPSPPTTICRHIKGRLPDGIKHTVV